MAGADVTEREYHSGSKLPMAQNADYLRLASAALK
jgi:hypothetical protein